jgi:putative component of toxin-antitoxin plasmid stabilization module
MATFATKKIEAVKGKQQFEQLVIDGIPQLDAFENSLSNPQYQSELRTIIAYMGLVADNERVPPKKFKEITPDKEPIKEFEFKTEHLRIYAIKKPNGKIVLLCGFKNNQEKDINRFRSLKDQFLKQQKQQS